MTTLKTLRGYDTQLLRIELITQVLNDIEKIQFLNATHPIQIHISVHEKLRFEKKVTKILTSNISEIYGSIILPNELDRELCKI